MEVKHYDFGGWATKYNMKCSDGRTIKPGFGKENDNKQVPLVWHHGHSDVGNVLGHALLENRPQGVYAYGMFNDTEAGQHAKKSVEHGDISFLSIYANNLKEKTGEVFHGMIREVSLVYAGANPGAIIDNLSVAHNDEPLESEAIIHTGIEITIGEDVEEQETESEEEGELEHAEGDESSEEDMTMKEIYDGMSDAEKEVVHAMLAAVLSGDGADDIAQHSDEGDEEMKHNVFNPEGKDKNVIAGTLTHENVGEFLTAVKATAEKCGSFRDAVIQHADDYGIKDIDILFPDSQTINNEPDFISRRQEWVQAVLSGVRRSPFSRVKSIHADITADEARAKGYITATRKKDEVFPLLKRETFPQTVYKKQKLDRDDILDITSFDVVSWMRREMRVMLDEELARAFLIGDGRDASSEDKIKEDRIRPIWTDDDLYAVHVVLDEDMAAADQIDAIFAARDQYKGSGSPTLYTTVGTVTKMLLLKDTIGRRLYSSYAELATALRVSNIVEVEVMENQTRTVGADTRELVGIIVNLNDYNVGADRGGEVTTFDDFDIDYNQYKYLIETRISGALIRPFSALVIEQKVSAPAAG